MQNEEVRDKSREKCLEHWGFTSYFKTKEFREQYEQTNIKNLGVPYPMQNLSIQEKTKKTYHHFLTKMVNLF